MPYPTDAFLFRSISEIADLCGVSIKTAQRYKSGTVCPPRAVILLLSGDLGIHDPEWSGWKVRDGQLISPEGWCITVGDARSVPLMRLQIGTYQTENRKLREPKIEEQPQPSEWDLARVLAG